MTKKRIPTKPTEVRDQLVQAASGIAGESDWPSTAPTQADVNTLSGDFHIEILN